MMRGKFLMESCSTSQQRTWTWLFQPAFDCLIELATDGAPCKEKYEYKSTGALQPASSTSLPYRIPPRPCLTSDEQSSGELENNERIEKKRDFVPRLLLAFWRTAMQLTLLVLLLLSGLCLSLRRAPESALRRRMDTALHTHAGLLTSCYSQPAAYKDAQGEDAYFALDNDIGVFDGVSDWASKGFDAGEYSRELSRSIAVYIRHERVEKKRDFVDLIGALSYCVGAIASSNNITGSTTACIASLHPSNRVLTLANLGDSSGTVYRRLRAPGGDGGVAQVLFRTRSTQHSHNTPYQLGHYARPIAAKRGNSGGEGGVQKGPQQPSYYFDRPFDSTLDYIPLQSGDVILLASDGLHDNLYPQEIAGLVSKHVYEAGGDVKQRLDACVSELAALATQRMGDREATSPWSEAETRERAQRRQQTLLDRIFNKGDKFASVEVRGGKPDDLTIVLSYYS